VGALEQQLAQQAHRTNLIFSFSPSFLFLQEVSALEQQLAQQTHATSQLRAQCEELEQTVQVADCLRALVP
jgi:hypothetical protein